MGEGLIRTHTDLLRRDEEGITSSGESKLQTKPHSERSLIRQEKVEAPLRLLTRGKIHMRSRLSPLPFVACVSRCVAIRTSSLSPQVIMNAERYTIRVDEIYKQQ
jgi:hypothetical protein